MTTATSSHKKWRTLIVTAMLMVLPITVAFFLIVGLTNVFSSWTYTEGRCTITAKQVLSDKQYNKSGSFHYEYWPYFKFIVQTADRHLYPASGYEVVEPSAELSPDGPQRIVNSYAIGKAYPCWYNPANPSQAGLVRSSWSVILTFLIVGLVVFTALAAFMLHLAVRLGEDVSKTERRIIHMLLVLTLASPAVYTLFVLAVHLVTSRK